MRWWGPFVLYLGSSVPVSVGRTSVVRDGPLEVLDPLLPAMPLS
ncbi:hypothetical protein GFS60_07502 (plasmid) [Rhodococcus sp. WAY2]|nr:hypothetical protein GFS60_07502 [Rhodococcus sp. WAY2]